MNKGSRFTFSRLRYHSGDWDTDQRMPSNLLNSLLEYTTVAINQQEKGWEKTLTGVPKEIYDLWERHFRDRGYKLRCEIIEFPGGMPGDVAMTLSWV